MRGVVFFGRGARGISGKQVLPCATLDGAVVLLQQCSFVEPQGGRTE